MRWSKGIVVAVALCSAASPAAAQTGWVPTFAGATSVDGTSGVYFSMGSVLSAELRAGVERREAGTAPVFAVSGSFGRATDRPSTVTCPLIVGVTCPAGTPPTVLSGMAWFGARHASAQSRWSWRAMAGVGLLRIAGDNVFERGRTGNTADS
ncbi:MAG: hypothetical protein MUE41_19175, partial [Gemmatimonadaceae bacterium]|nr:hypothetical protein [Gemmatimonadaceae bacterium]